MKHQLTDHDADVISGMVLIFAHATERAVEVLEEYWTQHFDDSPEYQRLIETMTKAYIMQGVPPRFARSRAEREAREKLSEVNRDVFRKEGNLHFAEWKEAVERLLDLTGHFTNCGMSTQNLVDKNVTALDLFDAMLSDSQFMCRLFLYMGDIPTDNRKQVEEWVKKQRKSHGIKLALAQDYFTPKV